MNKCLYCYENLEINDFHENCSKKFFGKKNPPELPYTLKDMILLADKVIKSQSSVTGVQAKLSLNIEKINKKNIPDRFTIVGLWGEYILKPPTKQYKNLPELEDLTIKLAEISKLKTVKHSLIRLKDGNLAYITKRMDRNKNNKIHLEDMCQLSDKLTENKYIGSYEQIAKIIQKYSLNPFLDTLNFFELIFFCFLTGNSDMHLKNFSLIKEGQNYILSPAYDLVPSSLIVIEDKEELALTLNSKKRKITKKDFIIFAKNIKIDDKSINNIFDKFIKLIPKYKDIIEKSFISDEYKLSYFKLITKRINLFL
ncbi:MAG: HipA domain-containing protein [Candidatus Sericytochromatia bacterium]